MAPSSSYTLKDVVAYAKAYGFVYPSSEIYDGVSALYDYGPNGTELKNNIRKYWWYAMTRMHPNIVGIDTSILMHPTVWKASGHKDAFNDPLIDNKDSKKRYRADTLVEDYISKIEGKIDKEIRKAKKRFGADFDEDKYRAESSVVQDYASRSCAITERLGRLLEVEDLAGIKSLIDELEIACPVSGTKNWTEVRQFNLMFETQLGSTSEGGKTYLRPETAQGIFVNFLNVQKSQRCAIPFGIAQMGKSFRNEIIARQFTFRMKEFEQMEMQFFVRPGAEMKWFEYWKDLRMAWHRSLGLKASKYRWTDHINLAHYANAASDIEFDFPFGFKELEGIHSRTDFDLKSHERHAKKKMHYFDPETKTSYIPYVIETSMGLDRMCLAVLSDGLRREQLPDGSERAYFRVHPALAPYKVSVFPLLKKPELQEKALKIYQNLQWDHKAFYDDKDSIGKRYRRSDIIGTPMCVTVDFDTTDSVTVRHRDTMTQDVVSISKLSRYISERTSWEPPKFS